MLKAVMYVQVKPDRFTVRDVTNARTIEQAANPSSSHPRTLIGNFTVAQALLKETVTEMKGPFVFKTDVLMHPVERIDGGLTEIEERVLCELAVGAGASRARAWVGPALTNAEVPEKLKAN